MMKHFRLAPAILAFICFTITSPASRAESPSVRNCTWCHGGRAQGYSPAPRLAGQRAEYIWYQLIEFNRHTRDNPFSKWYMWPAAANLSPKTVHDLATYFSMLPAQSANDGEIALIAQGKTIYQQGMPDSNVVACVVCHGPAAEGVREIPRLGGLEYAYLKRRLEQWGQGYAVAAGPPMPHIAGNLSPRDIAAIASYLSFLE